MCCSTMENRIGFGHAVILARLDKKQQKGMNVGRISSGSRWAAAFHVIVLLQQWEKLQVRWPSRFGS
jgi:hypothetical protein